MAKKVTKKGKKTARASSTQVQVTVPLAAMPGRACYAAGRVLADAKNAVTDVNRIFNADRKKKDYTGDIQVENSLAVASLRLRMVASSFPLTKERLAPLEKEFSDLSQGKKIKSQAVEKVIREAVQELAILEGKAMEVCK